MLSKLFHRRYFISLGYLLVMVLGIAAWQHISLEMSPNVSLPSLSVSYTWGSTSPEVMEKEVTRPVEQAANRLRDVNKIESITEEGRSTVTITFNREVPVEYRKVELQEYLFGLQETLPANVRQPTISRRVPEALQEMQTFIVYSLSGDRPVRQLYEFASQQIRLPLLGIEGLADIEINGARPPALTIEFDTPLLERYNINPQRVLSDIRERMQWRSSGFAETPEGRFSMLAEPQFRDVASIRAMPLSVPGSSRLLTLSQVAEVSISDYPAKSMKRINGSPALSVNFVKQSGADAIGLAESIRTEIDNLEANLPATMTLQLEQDATEELREQFGNLQYQALISLLVVFGVLLLFIRRLRAPFVILGSIIYSLLMSVGILYMVGYTLNILTLAGLTVALGMIIDNAVVVFEQVNPGLPKSREARIDHIRKELPRAIVPVLGSTLTTVGIFIPLFFAVEKLQLFLVPLAVALSSTLISSVFIAMSWIPYSLIWLVPRSSHQQARTEPSPVARLAQKMRRLVLGFFTWRFKLRWLLYVALLSLAFIPYKFFNETYFGSPWERSQQQRIYVNIRTPQGTPLQEIDKMARNFEKIVKPYEEAFSFYETRLSEYSGARLVFTIKNEYMMKPDPYIFYAEAMYLAARTGNSGISVGGLGQGISTSLNTSTSGQRIYLSGFSYNELLELAQNLRTRLKENRRVRTVDIHGSGWFSRSDLYQYYLQLHDDQLAQKGLNRRDVINAIALDVNPSNTFGRVELDGQQMFLIGRNKNRQNSARQLMEEKREVSGADSTLFALKELALLGREKSQATIRREDQSYKRVVSVDFLGPYRMARDYIENVLEQTPVPIGANITFDRSSIFGFGSEQNIKNILLLLGLTILSVWMIVSALLESWVDPLLVILAVPFSLIGVMMGSLYNDIAFDHAAIAGSLLCVGVVVNNAILLMHEMQHQRQKGIIKLRGWYYVYRNKMRAVLITTLTTIGGLLPLIFLGGSDFWQTLATVVVWGLSVSTLLIVFFTGMWSSKPVCAKIEK